MLPVLFDVERMRELYKLCETLGKSNLLPVSLRGKPNDILVIVTMAHEYDIAPMTALNSMQVIQGKIVIPPNLMIGLVYRKIPGAIIKITPDEKNKTVKCFTARSKDNLEYGYESFWDIEKAKSMGLYGKDNYNKQLMTMLRWRAIGESCRVTFADVIFGLYMDEEFKDVDGKIVPGYDNDPSGMKEAKAMYESDFPTPEHEKKLGPLFRVQNAKFRGFQLKDIDRPEMEEYLETLKKRTGLKTWENELITAMADYLANYDAYQSDLANVEFPDTDEFLKNQEKK